MIAKLSGLLRSPALRAAFFLMAGGAGFALGNLLLAKALSTEQFGVVSLFLALNQLGLTLGPLGLELPVNRRGLKPSPSLLRFSLASGTFFGLVIAGSAVLLYDLSIQVTLCLVLACTASAVNRLGYAFLQAERKLGASLFLGQIHNYVVLLTVPLVLLFDGAALLVIAVIAFGYVVTAIVGWRAAWPRQRSELHEQLTPLVREALAGVGIVLAVQMLWQLERLVIPRTLSMADLGTFAVLAAIAGAPFRMLQIGIGHTLLPGLRGCHGPDEVRRLLLRETKLVGAATLGSIAIIVVATPFIVERFLDGRYEISTALLVAAILTGLIKIWHGFSSSVVQAFGSTRDLIGLTSWSWVGVLTGGGCAIYGAQFGLTGVVYGAGLGWLVVTLAATSMANSCVRAHAKDPSTGPAAAGAAASAD